MSGGLAVVGEFIDTKAIARDAARSPFRVDNLSEGLIKGYGDVGIAAGAAVVVSRPHKDTLLHEGHSVNSAHFNSWRRV